jgi:hypothetical protein
LNVDSRHLFSLFIRLKGIFEETQKKVKLRERFKRKEKLIMNVGSNFEGRFLLNLTEAGSEID